MPVAKIMDFQRYESAGSERNLFLPAGAMMSRVKVYAVNQVLRWTEDEIRLVLDREAEMRASPTVRAFIDRHEVELFARRRVKDCFRDWIALNVESSSEIALLGIASKLGCLLTTITLDTWNQKTCFWY